MLNDNISVLIRRIRFALMLGVLLIHSSNIALVPGGSPGVDAALSLEKFMNSVVLDPIVPLFFFISGLLNLKESNFMRKGYAAFLKKRFATLLVPFVLWNILAFAIRNVIKIIPFTRQFCDSQALDAPSFWSLFVAPELVPMWFIRNLLLLLAFAPLIWYIMRKLRWFGLVLLFFVDISSAYLAGIFYFGLGQLLRDGLNRTAPERLTMVLRIISGSWLTVVALCLVFTLFFPEIRPGVPAFPREVLLACLTVGGLAFYALWFGRIEVPGALASSAFFIYAFHGIISPYVNKIVTKAVDPQAFLTVMLSYALDFVLVAIVSVALYFLMKKVFPRTLGLLTGSRA